jgi:hypothetical protein
VGGNAGKNAPLPVIPLASGATLNGTVGGDGNLSLVGPPGGDASATSGEGAAPNGDSGPAQAQGGKGARSQTPPQPDSVGGNAGTPSTGGPPAVASSPGNP